MFPSIRNCAAGYGLISANFAYLHEKISRQCVSFCGISGLYARVAGITGLKGQKYEKYTYFRLVHLSVDGVLYFFGVGFDILLNIYLSNQSHLKSIPFDSMNFARSCCFFVIKGSGSSSGLVLSLM